MPLRMSIKPQEWFMIGDTKVVNVDLVVAKFSIDGASPVLRQAHTLMPEDANTPAKLVYLAAQRLYLGFPSALHNYFDAVRTLLRTSPETLSNVQKANNEIKCGSTYNALLEYRKLINIMPQKKALSAQVGRRNKHNYIKSPSP